jgi:hypothetical protein
MTHTGLERLGRVVATLLEHDNVHASFGERGCHRGTAGARSHDDDVTGDPHLLDDLVAGEDSRRLAGAHAVPAGKYRSRRRAETCAT